MCLVCASGARYFDIKSVVTEERAGGYTRVLMDACELARVDVYGACRVL